MSLKSRRDPFLEWRVLEVRPIRRLSAQIEGGRTSGTAFGYTHADYAASLTEFGQPRAMPASGGWILERPIAADSRRDGMGCYPLFNCREWRALPDDLQVLGRDLVSVVMVP